MRNWQLNKFFDGVLRRRWLTIALVLLCTLALGAGGRFVTITFDYHFMFGEDNPEFVAFKRFESTYTTSNTAFIAVAPKDGLVFAKEPLAAIEELTEAAWLVPYASRVDSLTNYSHSVSIDDDLFVGPLVEDAYSLSGDDLELVEQAALGAAEIAGRLVALDGRVGALTITFVLPEQMDAAVVEITDHLHSMLIEARELHPDIDFYLTGDVPLNRALADAAQDDFLILAPIAFLLIIAAAALLLRSVYCTLAISFVTLCAMATTMGLAGWLGTVFSPLSSMVPIIVMAICVAHSVHVASTVLNSMRRGTEKNESIAESLHVNWYPMFLTSITTMIGFLSLNASDSPPFHILGNYVAFGVACAYFYSITLLPALFSILPLRARLADNKRPAFFDKLGDFVVERRRPLLYVSIAVAAGLIAGIPRNELTDRWAHYFDDSFQFRRDTDFIFENLTGVDMLEYSLNSGSDGGITDPDYLNTVEAFAEWFRAQPEVFHVRAFPDVIKRLNKTFHSDDPAYYRIPDDPELAAQYLLLYEFSLPFGMDLNDRIDVSKSATRMTVVVRTLSSRDHREIDDRAQAWLRDNAPDLAERASGVTMISAYLSKRNIEGMLGGTIVAMALISIMLTVLFRSIRVGAVSLVPNFIPAAMSFGLWGYLVGQMGISSSVVAVVAFGIIVDDTIHFLSKYLNARRDGKAAPDAVRHVLRTVGPALWTTTAVLSIGFLVFASSGYVGSWSLGLLLAITLVIALVADFLLLPVLLMLVDRSKS